ncbi:Crotonobetainyl-CoA reductase [Streptomyces violarus]
MSVADRAAGPLAQSGAPLAPSEAPGRVLVPYGQGRIRGLDADELGAHGAAMDRLVALGLPVVPGLTVPAGASTSLGEPGTAEAAVDLVEQLSGRRIGDAGRPLLLRLSASAPTEIAGLPPDLACLGVTSGNADDLGAVIGRTEALHEVWAATVRMVAEYALDVSGAVLDDALLDTPEPRARVEALLALVARHGSQPFPDDPAQQLALAARALLARWDSPRARRSRRAQRLPADLTLALHVQALRIGPADHSGYGTAVSRDPETGRLSPQGFFFRGVRRSAPPPHTGEPLHRLGGRHRRPRRDHRRLRGTGQDAGTGTAAVLHRAGRAGPGRLRYGRQGAGRAGRGHRACPGGGRARRRRRADAVPVAVSWQGGVPLLDGTAPFVLDGADAEALVVAAAGTDGVDLFLADPREPGVTVRRVPTLDLSRGQEVVTFSGARARALTAGGEGTDIVSRALDVALIALAAEQLGGAQAALDMTVAHVRDRTQFGRAIGGFQAVKHACADMLLQVEAARSAVVRAVLADGSPGALAEAAAVAQAWCGEAFVAVAAECVQFHGGMGFTWEHDAHLYFRRAQSDAVLLGGAAHHRERLAGLLGW